MLVFPEVDEPDEVEINPNDLKIDVFRSSGPGGQSVNTTDSAVRITHVPTGIVVSMQNEKSQLQNREAGMRVLRARLLARQQEELDAIASDARKSQIRGMDRSERIRTYNFPENRIADHRTGLQVVQPRPGHGRRTRADHRLVHRGRRGRAPRGARLRLLTRRAGR